MEPVTYTEAELTIPEAARRLGIPGDEVYRLIFRGELTGGPHEDGAVYVSGSSVDQYLAQRSSGQPQSG